MYVRENKTAMSNKQIKILNNNPLDFNTRITLQRQQQSICENGNTITTFENIKSVWCSITAIETGQNFSRMKNDVETIYEIAIRYFDEAKLTKKILYGDRTFNVLSCLCQDDLKSIITFKAKEIV